MEGKMVIFCAPSGSGKTTIVRRLLAKGMPLKFSVSATSRKPREGEKHGKDYYYLSVADFKKAVEEDRFLEWEEVYPDQYYGTFRSEVERIWKEGQHVIFDVDVMGGLNIKKAYGDRALAVFIVPPSMEVLEQRLRARATDDQASLKKRLQKAEYELSFAPQFDLRIVNDDLEEAVEKALGEVDKFLSGGR
ncbi:MAG: guanylate kinase, partial [Bacteroidetes bacterium]